MTLFLRRIAPMMVLSLVFFAGVPSASADVDPDNVSSTALGQYGQPEMAALSPAPMTSSVVASDPYARTAKAPAVASQSSSAVHPGDFPKVQNTQDELMARKFSWWPTDARPAPYKDPERSGYWWWPEIPGESRPWGNQGYIYVRKIIFDYKSTEGEMKPSLVIKRILKNVKVLFDYDKSDLRDDARDLLNKAMYTLEHNPKADILITGNADIRGSEQYNQRLGERRAATVQDYMTRLGLAPGRIRILSRGKLDALAPTHDIVGMQKDRNAQFMIAEVEEVMIPADKAALFEDKVIEETQELESAVRVDEKEYVIQSGDTLWDIAKREYGSGHQWKRIYQYNQDVISNPNKPKKGTRIRIPIE